MKALLEQLKNDLGPDGIIDQPKDQAGYLNEYLRRFAGKTPAVLLPKTTAQVAQCVQLCRQAGVGLVPQGGNTGYMGGATPSETGDEMVLSLRRMNRIREVDALNNTMTVEAGCILADVQQAAQEQDRLFPLSLGAEGTAQIGGNLATNAGGVHVLRYGNARDLTLGLEVVLPDGQIWDGLRRLRKDNTGYDLKQLFIGAEGTLGVITATVLKLYPRPQQTCTALLAVRDPDAALELLAAFRAAGSDALVAYEYLTRSCIDLVLRLIPKSLYPLDAQYDHYVLVELTSGDETMPIDEWMATVVEKAFDQGLALDGVIAGSARQARALWKLREAIPPAARKLGGTLKFDVSVPVSKQPEFLRRATVLSSERMPDAVVTPFGHFGDGNIHFNLVQQDGTDMWAFNARLPEIQPHMHGLVNELGGSFSAEHGIGRLHVEQLAAHKSPVELALMRTLKQALDPEGLMNPGKLFAP